MYLFFLGEWIKTVFTSNIRCIYIRRKEILDQEKKEEDEKRRVDLQSESIADENEETPGRKSKRKAAKR